MIIYRQLADCPPRPPPSSHHWQFDGVHLGTGSHRGGIARARFSRPILAITSIPPARVLHPERPHLFSLRWRTAGTARRHRNRRTLVLPYRRAAPQLRLRLRHRVLAGTLHVTRSTRAQTSALAAKPRPASPAQPASRPWAANSLLRHHLRRAQPARRPVSSAHSRPHRRGRRQPGARPARPPFAVDSTPAPVAASALATPFPP